MTRWNQTERKYISRLFEIKPDCSGEELMNLMMWMNTKNMSAWDKHYGNDIDEVISNVITTGFPFA